MAEFTSGKQLLALGAVVAAPKPANCAHHGVFHDKAHLLDLDAVESAPESPVEHVRTFASFVTDHTSKILMQPSLQPSLQVVRTLTFWRGINWSGKYSQHKDLYYRKRIER